MNRSAWFRAGFRSLVAGSVLALATASSAEDGWVTLPFTPLQLAIAPGTAQVFTKATPVYGLRVSVFYGIQSEVVGLDVGSVNDVDSLSGVGVGLCNVTRESGAGVQLGGASHVEVDFAGFQAGLANLIAGRLEGLQLGIVNSAEGGSGLQIGAINYSDSMRGVQIGVVNWNGNGFLPVFPVVNFGF